MQGKEAKEGLALRLEISALSDLGQWSHYLPSVARDPHGRCPDLQTQKGTLVGKVGLWEKPTARWLALGFGREDHKI